MRRVSASSLVCSRIRANAPTGNNLSWIFNIVGTGAEKMNHISYRLGIHFMIVQFKLFYSFKLKHKDNITLYLFLIHSLIYIDK